MNDLHVVTKSTENPKVFDIYWMTGLVQKGRVRTTVTIQDDCRIAAELSTLQYLLETKNVCGHNKAGAGLRLWVSCGAIPKLLKQESEKFYLSPYANFLRTRFLGLKIDVEKRKVDWADELCDRPVDEIRVVTPSMTVIEVAGVGPVELTAHAVGRYIERFDRPPAKAWRELTRLAKEAIPLPVKRNEIHNLKHRNPGSFFASKKVILVVAQPDHAGMLPRLVTVSTLRPTA